MGTGLSGGRPGIVFYGCDMVAHWTITLARGDAAIVVRGEGDDPHAPDRIDCEIRGSPGGVYRALRDRIRPGPWSMLTDRMKDKRDLYWIADCAYTEAALHPGWSVKTDLPPLPEPEGLPEDAVP